MKTNLLKTLVLTATGIVLLTFNACKKEDTTAPIITTPADSYTVALDGTFAEPSVTANDEKDGDLTSSVVKTGTVNTALAGTYTLEYSVSDAAGNAAETKTISVTVIVTVANLVATYDVTDKVGTGTPYAYQDAISASSVAGRFLVSKFAYYTNGGVSFDLSGTTGQTVTVGTQTVVCGNPSATRVFSGSGTVSANGDTVMVNYTETTNGTSVTGTETYVKK